MKVIIGGNKKPLYDGELWMFNNTYSMFNGQIDKLFIMHKQVIAKYKPVFDWDKINAFSDQYGFDIILLHDIPETNKYTKYPYDKIVDAFKTDFFCSTIDYMIAYALYKKYDEIEICFDYFLGDVDYTDSLWEKCGANYWIGRAEGMGVRVDTSDSNVFTTRSGEPYAING